MMVAFSTARFGQFVLEGLNPTVLDFHIALNGVRLGWSYIMMASSITD
jgi:hypothetical protein